MILDIVQYGDPVLRKKGRRIDPLPVSDELRQLADDMLETMYDANGVGLAAQQIGQAIQLAMVDVSHDEDCVSYLRVNGEECELAELMPLVFVNPELSFGKERASEIEGCLSFEEIRAEVRRPTDVVARLQTLDGEMLEIETDGLLSRAIQHETDHLFGKLFIDRMSSARKLALRRQLKEMQRAYLSGS